MNTTTNFTSAATLGATLEGQKLVPYQPHAQKFIEIFGREGFEAKDTFDVIAVHSVIKGRKVARSSTEEYPHMITVQCERNGKIGTFSSGWFGLTS